MFGKPRREDSRYKDITPYKKCTDVLCLVVFFTFVLGAIACAAVGYARGNPRRLVNPTDSAGRICGEEPLKHRPFLFFFDLLQCTTLGASVALGCPTPQVCVPKCPTTYFSYLPGKALEAKSTVNTDTVSKVAIREIRAKLICQVGVDATTSEETIDSLVQTQKCAAYYVPSIPVVGRCIPSVFNALLNENSTVDVDKTPIQNVLGEVLTKEKLEKAAKYLAKFNKLKHYSKLIFKDLLLSWRHILGGLGLVLVFSLLWLLILQFVLLPFIFFSILAFLAIFGFGSYWSFTQHKKLSTRNATADFGIPNPFISAVDQYSYLTWTWLVLGYVSAVLGVIFLLVSIFVWRHIRLAIELIKEATQAIFQMPLVVFWPVIPFIMQILVLAFWISSSVYLASIGTEEFGTRDAYNDTESLESNPADMLLSEVSCDTYRNFTGYAEVCGFIKYGDNEYTVHLQIFMVFMFFWMMNFTVAFDQLVLAGAFITRYWSLEKMNNQLAICGSAYRTVRYHMGSLALGSLIIAVVQMIRVFLEYVDRRVRGSGNKVAIFIVRCLKCCMWCLENVLKFINRSAYVMMGMFGRNFCLSSRDAFLLIMRNVLRTGVVDQVVDFICIISKLAITALAGVGAYFWFEKKVYVLEGRIPELNFGLIPVVVVTVGAFVVTSTFFSVIDLAVDTLFLCFLEDLERNEGTAEKPYFMSRNLLNVLGKGDDVQRASVMEFASQSQDNGVRY